MTIYIGADHRGFALKGMIAQALAAEGRGAVDVGAVAYDPADDYPDFARVVAEKVATGGAGARGIVICGSGFGVDIVANKFNGVRSALAMSPEHVTAGRHDDDVNVLSIAADLMTPEKALEIVRAFLNTPFEANEERYVRRLQKISAIESGQ
ncbi:MAG TPA: RpiB/LacA/LacB family sugar-phosphate isomerase [Candidatus Paceibacterota bacterium]|nr:RpiB/LacA/LacB family sugar-phosphate isomerase [Candidatus Paceibacterota bacterium]